MKKVLIIGANSYIGKSFCQYVSTRCKNDIVAYKTSASDDSWKNENLMNYDAVLMLSGIVHKKENKSLEDIYDKVNHKLAVQIAKAVQASGVKQFIFMSTAAVYGSKVKHITKHTVPNPTTYYGKSKLAAEKDIMKLKSDKFLITVVRPPMVYGEGCKGNYPRLVKLARMVPVFPEIHNKRSMIHIDELNKYLAMLIQNEKGGVFHPQDKDYVDTCDLVINIRKGMGKNTWVTGAFNQVIYLLSRYIKSLNKMFSDYYYDKDLE